MSKVKTVEVVERTSCQVQIPLASAESDAYISRTFDVTLVRDHAITLRRVFNAMNAQHRKLKNGRHVDSPVDVIRALLEDIADASEKA